MQHLDRFISDCDRKTEQAKRRLAEQQEDLTIEQTTKVSSICNEILCPDSTLRL